MLGCEYYCSVIVTYVDKVGPVLAGHTETKIPPEPCVFLDHLRRREQQDLES